MIRTAIKLKLTLILALGLALIVCLGTALGMFFAEAERSVAISGSSIFYVSGGAEVWAHKETAATEDGGDSDESFYAMFVLKSSYDSVAFRKNLALHWWENGGVENEGAAAPVAKEGYFNLEIGFESVAFERFVIALETQQYVQDNEKSKTTNYIVFIPAGEEGGVYVLVTDDKDAEPQDAPVVSPEHIYINLAAGSVDGNYAVRVANTAPAEDEDYSDCPEFKNIGGTYVKYSSSSTTPVIPLTFSAEFSADSSSETARMTLYSMNGQSFEYNEGTTSEVLSGTTVDHYSSGSVTDNVPPVLCLGSGLRYLKEGSEIDLDYIIIDVLGSSTTSSVGYYIPTDAQIADENINYEDYLSESLFRTVEDSDDQYIILHGDSYIPAAGDYNANIFDAADCAEDDKVSYLQVAGAVKVYVKITDSSAEESAYVMLDWYIDDDYLITPAGSGAKFIALAEDTQGATFAYTDNVNKISAPVAEENGSADEAELAARWQALVDAYQKLVDEAAAGLKAGSKNYFYLPPMTGVEYEYGGQTYTGSLFADNCDKYSDMSFSVYYMTRSSSTNSASGTADSLSITVSSGGKYRFTVYATDSRSNKMYYFDGDGKKVEFAASEIWDMREAEEDTDYEGTDKYLPWFEFEVESTEFTISNAGEQDTAYVGSSYSINSDEFEVNGVDYELKYKLYYFDYDKYYGETGKELGFDELMELMEQGRDFRLGYNQYLVRIMSTDEADEINYSAFENYEWDASGLTFVPQDENGFYLVECEMYSTVYSNAPSMYGYMGILATVSPDPLGGEDTWLQDNLTSVILLAIAGAALIGIIVLLVIRPKEQGDLDTAIIESDSKNKNKNKK